MSRKSSKPASDPSLETVDQTLHDPAYQRRIFTALRRIIRGIDLHSRQLASSHQITWPQLTCLQAIHEYQPITASKLAKQVYLSPSTVVGIIDRLEEKGLLARTRDRADRRVVWLDLTERGRQVVAKTPRPLQETLAEALHELPELEQASLTVVLEKLVEQMEARHRADIDGRQQAPRSAPKTPYTGDNTP